MSENIFKDEFLNLASKLDAVSNRRGEFVKASSSVVETQDRDATLALIDLSSSIVKSDAYAKEIKQIATLFKDSLMRYYGYLHIMETFAEAESDEDDRTLDELLSDLNALIGLEEVKAVVKNLIAYQKVRKQREAQGLYSEKRTMHLAFIGNPGTGKTTVARIIGRVYRQLGLLSRGHFIEVSRTDLIAGYQGQTALKVKKVIERAKGGVLFIDEAYSITENDRCDSYGRECLTELTKALEDHKNDLVVIVAGYIEPMKKFFESNPGLKSRFNTFIEFRDFSGKELVAIFDSLCRENAYCPSDEARRLVVETLMRAVAGKNEHFANGRFVRNVFESLVMSQAMRVSQIDIATRNQLEEITLEDVQRVFTEKERNP